MVIRNNLKYAKQCVTAKALRKQNVECLAEKYKDTEGNTKYLLFTTASSDHIQNTLHFWSPECINYENKKSGTNTKQRNKTNSVAHILSFYEERLTDPKLFYLKRRRLRDLTKKFAKYLMISTVKVTSFFTLYNGQTQGYYLKGKGKQT